MRGVPMRMTRMTHLPVSWTAMTTKKIVEKKKMRYSVIVASLSLVKVQHVALEKPYFTSIAVFHMRKGTLTMTSINLVMITNRMNEGYYTYQSS